MSLELRDLRAKISVKADLVLAGKAHALNCDKQELVRIILDEWAEKTLHEATVVLRYAGGEGKSGTAPE